MGGERGHQHLRISLVCVLLGRPRAPGCQHRDTTPLFFRKVHGIIVSARPHPPGPFLSPAERRLGHQSSSSLSWERTPFLSSEQNPQCVLARPL